MSTSIRKCCRGLLLLCVFSVFGLQVSSSFSQPGTQGLQDTVNLCFLSDSQEPMFVERLVLKYNRNAEARSLIFEAIAVAHPNAVIHLGDMVARGSNNDDWSVVDTFVRVLRQRHIDFSPIPGNHEYLIMSKDGIANFRVRFPDVPMAGYAKKYGNIAIVLFNSDFDELSNEERIRQLAWYRQTLIDYDADSTVDFVVAGCHRPPFTNSKIVSGSKDVRDEFLPAFTRSKKARVFLSGHSHAFEHFKAEGKDFLVIGGSGGLQHPVTTGSSARYLDIFSNTQRKRMFHFLTMRSHHKTLEVDVNMLKADFSGFDRIRILTLGVD